MNILGTGSALPHLSVTNDRLSEFLETSDEWIKSRTGIAERRILSGDETILTLGAMAAERALEDAGIRKDEIDFLLCSTVQGDHITPSLACLMQGALGLDCPAIDINGACAGFPYALDMADAYIASGKTRHILIVCSEGMSRITDWTDRASCVLFGDGAGAVVVGPGTALKKTRLTSMGDMRVIHASPEPGNSPFGTAQREKAGLYMAGQEVYKFAVANSLKDIECVLDQSGLTPDDISFFLLHQANKRIIDAVRARLKQGEDKFPANIEARGNTSSASVPILLDELNRAGMLKKGDILAMSAFGAGLTTGACIIEWTKG